jgi:hypothetical protein
LDLYQAALLDSVAVVTCSTLLWKYARLSGLHPGFAYLVFHLLVFTFRGYAILAGAPTLFSNWPGTLPVSDGEIAWALNLADVALVTMTAAWIKVAADDRRKQGILRRNPDPNSAMLSERVISIVGAVAAPIGLLALLYFGDTPTLESYKMDLGAWSTSSWTVVTQGWTGLVLLSLIYYYGFRKLLVPPMCAYLLVMAVQRGARYRVVIPLIFLLLVWLSRTGTKWPRLWMVGAAFAVTLVFFPLKTIDSMVHTGRSASQIAEVVENSIANVTRGEAADQSILDQFASYVSLIDHSGRYYYGTLYYPLITMPIPKQWWPEKPPINLYAHEISTPWRPMAQAGMVATLHGESYANLGIAGIIIISYFAAYGLGWFYFAALRKSYFSVYRFTYIVVASNLIQIYRDGLISLVVFTVLNMGPLIAIAALSYFSSRRIRTWHAPSSSVVPGRRTTDAQG